MALTWVHESAARWDRAKQEIVGGAPAGIFKLGSFEVGALVPGDWWHVEDDDGTVLGFGWMDIVGGDAEVLLAVSPTQQKKGVGTFIMDKLAREAAERGVNYLSNVVRESHPDADTMTAWLQKRGFSPRDDGRLERRATKG